MHTFNFAEGFRSVEISARRQPSVYKNSENSIHHKEREREGSVGGMGRR